MLYEPLVGAAAHALAAVLDRVRHGTLPASVARDASVQQAATLAANLAARSDRWPEFRRACRPHADGDVKSARARGDRARLVGEMALELIVARRSRRIPLVLAVAVALDLAIGDPVYRAHPVRLIGRDADGDRSDVFAADWRRRLRRAASLLFVLLARAVARRLAGCRVAGAVGFAAGSGGSSHVFLLYSLLALGDLLHHGLADRIARCGRGDLDRRAQAAVSQLVGRDTDRMDGAACRRAAVESLSENLTDGFIEPAVLVRRSAALPGLVLFKVVSTMDSMVGYKTPRYLRFGWCGARLDDVMNYVPARLTWLVLAAVAAVMPGVLGRERRGAVGLAAARAAAGPELGMERGRDGRRDPAPARRPDLDEGRAGHRPVDWRSGRSAAADGPRRESRGYAHRRRGTDRGWHWRGGAARMSAVRRLSLHRRCPLGEPD